MVSKHAAPAVFHLPGGKPEVDEPERTARCHQAAGVHQRSREISEELGVPPVAPVPYLVVIAGVGWTTGGDGLARRLAPATRDAVVPQLMTDGLLAGTP